MTTFVPADTTDSARVAATPPRPRATSPRRRLIDRIIAELNRGA